MKYDKEMYKKLSKEEKVKFRLKYKLGDNQNQFVSCKSGKKRKVSKNTVTKARLRYGALQVENSQNTFLL